MHEQAQAAVSSVPVSFLLAVCGNALRALSCLGWACGRSRSAADLNAYKNGSVHTAPSSTWSAAMLYLTVQGLELLCCLPLRRSDLVCYHHPVHLHTPDCSPLLHKAMSAHSKTRHMSSVYMQHSHAMHSPSTCVSGTYSTSYRCLVATSSASAFSVSPSYSLGSPSKYKRHLHVDHCCKPIA